MGANPRRSSWDGVPLRQPLADTSTTGEEIASLWGALMKDIIYPDLPLEWFTDESRPPAENRGPHLLIVDGFYDDPDAVRALALGKPFVQYSPPLVEQVGEGMAMSPEFQDTTSIWRASALFTYRGNSVRHPVNGFRYNGPEVRERLTGIVREEIDDENWALGGDGWNGAFHLRSGGKDAVSIHHHYREGDVFPRGWSGLVYLSPDAPEDAGTSIWRHKATGKCIAAKGAVFDRNISAFERVHDVACRYNRLVLFRENVLHRAEHGFGDGDEARLTQTFFFRAGQG